MANNIAVTAGAGTTIETVDTGGVHTVVHKSVGFHVEVRGTLDSAAPGVIAAAGDYAANDVLSQSASNGVGVAWVFSSIARASGGTGIVIGGTLTCSVAAMTPALRLWLFKANPSNSELDDNAAFSFSATDRALLVGWLDFSPLISGGGVSVGVWKGSQEFITSGGDDLYGILQTLDAFTNESASMTVDIHLRAYQD